MFDAGSIAFVSAAMIVVAFYVKGEAVEVAHVLTKIDGNKYVVRNVHNKHKAADMLGILNLKVLQLIERMKVAHPNAEQTRLLEENYNPANVSEGTESSNYTSYSVNKGEKLVFCLRSRDGLDRLVDENTLFYVAAHELGHLMTSEVGHTKSFWDNFRMALREAVVIGVYNPVNYSETPQEYCGIMLKNSVIAEDILKKNAPKNRSKG
jgi:hypothetical protein